MSPSALPGQSGVESFPDTLPRILPTLSLEATAFTRSQLISPEAPQIAMAGRSNVGKSSLINALAGKKKLAKTSSTPGKTRSINYYRIEGTNAYFVDLPGYGYARCSLAEHSRWTTLLHYYLAHTPGIRTLALLIDPRLFPQKSDRELLVFAASLSLPVLPVLTKADKCGKRELNACIRSWEPFLQKSTILVTSAMKKSGLNDIWRFVLPLLLDGELPATFFIPSKSAMP